LPDGVAGEVRNISQGTQQVNAETVTVLTFRLERHDPSGGRTSVVTVRLRGSQAIGFATEGDWVEAQGKDSKGFLDVRRAVNRTSGAEYQGGTSRGQKIAQAVIFTLALGFILTIVVILVINLI
jgi:hypothetical protein